MNKEENKSLLASTKARFLTGVAVASVVATNAMADVTVDPATGVISGTIDTAPFFSGAAVVITALAAFWAVKRVVGLFGR